MTVTAGTASGRVEERKKRWQRYPAYKESGVEWIDEIPTHWQPWKVAHGFRYIGSGTTPSSTNRDYYEGEIPWVNTSELRDGLVQDTAKKLTDEALDDHSSLRVYPAGTLLVALYGATIGKVGILDIPATTNQACCALAEPDGLDSKFTFYWLIAHRQPLIQLGYGGGQQNISQETIRSLRIPAPPLDEQRAIAGFLDRETERIDTLIARKERLIELLQEKRTALISHAVTKGLDPDAPMQDSDVEWLGEVPAHWDVVRLKFLADVRTGVAKGRKLNGETVELPYLRVANVQDGYLDLSDVATIEVLTDEVERYSLKVGDVLMNEGGDYDKLGRGTVWEGQIEPCLHQNHVFAVRPNSVDSDWLTTITLTSYAKHYFILRSKQSTNLASISSSNLQELPVLMPPKDEQRGILRFIGRETEQIDHLVSTVREHIEKLREYRTALISAAVTGTIDVRGEANGS